MKAMLRGRVCCDPKNEDCTKPQLDVSLRSKAIWDNNTLSSHVRKDYERRRIVRWFGEHSKGRAGSNSREGATSHTGVAATTAWLLQIDTR